MVIFLFLNSTLFTACMQEERIDLSKLINLAFIVLMYRFKFTNMFKRRMYTTKEKLN